MPARRHDQSLGSCVFMCVCVCEREREREKGGGYLMMKKVPTMPATAMIWLLRGPAGVLRNEVIAVVVVVVVMNETMNRRLERENGRGKERKNSRGMRDY